MTRIVAILGAESTGKTTLARVLALELRALGLKATVVGEYLREFCEREGRTPRVDEQAAITAEQTRRIEQAAAQNCDIVLADTTALMTAVYSELVFNDRSLYAQALAWQRERCCATLLTGLDLPWLADGHQRDGPHVREPVDALIRAALAGAGLACSVIYGEGEARTGAAVQALRRELLLPVGDAGAATGGEPQRWQPVCAECLVAECEHLKGKG